MMEKSVFFQQLKDQQQSILIHMRQVIMSHVEACQEREVYGTWQFYKGERIMGLGAHIDHISLYTYSDQLLDDLSDLLKGYRQSGGTIFFPLSNMPDDELLEIIIEKRLQTMDYFKVD